MNDSMFLQSKLDVFIVLTVNCRLVAPAMHDTRDVGNYVNFIEPLIKNLSKPSAESQTESSHHTMKSYILMLHTQM